MLRLTITRRPPPPPGSWAARFDRLLGLVALALRALFQLSLALLIWVPEQSQGGDVPHPECSIFEPVPGKPHEMRPMLDVCNQR